MKMSYKNVFSHRKQFRAGSYAVTFDFMLLFHYLVIIGAVILFTLPASMVK